ncbi:MAG: hypothetical protein JXQ72_08040, partial [Anaerolineae bacterium]|nr:hypothetical protein [Anaerolineae bacterium]
MPQVDITLTGEVAGPAWDQVRTVRYDSAMKPLGYGMVGAVYRTDEADDRRQYVVKVPHDEAGQAEFEAEYTILRDLWRKLGDPVPVPPVAWGQRADTGGRVLVMPCYEHLLSDTIQDLLRERDWLAAERTAVQAARDYARVMEAVRELKQSCTDRKVKDFFLDSRGQLIIIDWNVLNPDTPDFRAAELQVFGQLWHQLLLQRIGSPPFKPFSDLLWLPRERTDAPGGFPSVGLRLILAAAVHPDISRRFVQDGHPSHTPLRGVLDEWLKVLFSPNSADLQHWFPGEYEAVQADLDWRLAGYPADRKADRDRLMNQFIVSGFAGDTHSQAIVGRLESGNLEGADGYVQEQLQAQIDFVTRQKLERWGVVLQTLGAARDAFGSGSRADVLMRDLRADLLDVMETLVDDPVGDGPGVLDAAGNRLDDITSRLQTDLGERPLRQNLSTPLAQLMAEIALRHRAILYRNVDWNLRERYTAWR